MKNPNPEIEKYRLTEGRLGSDASYGNNGFFLVPGPRGRILICIVSDGEGWDHISLEVQPPQPWQTQRLPYWDEMCFIKDLFWEEEECVLQYHPPHSRYVNWHPNVLHLWKPQGVEFPQPPLILV